MVYVWSCYLNTTGPSCPNKDVWDAQGVGMPADGVAALASTTAALQSAKAHGSDIVCTE